MIEDASSTRPLRFEAEKNVSVWWDLTTDEWATFEREVCSQAELRSALIGTNPRLDEKFKRWVGRNRHNLRIFDRPEGSYIVSVGAMAKFVSTHPEHRTTAARRL